MAENTNPPKDVNDPKQSSTVTEATAEDNEPTSARPAIGGHTTIYQTPWIVQYYGPFDSSNVPQLVSRPLYDYGPSQKQRKTQDAAEPNQHLTNGVLQNRTDHQHDGIKDVAQSLPQQPPKPRQLDPNNYRIAYIRGRFSVGPNPPMLVVPTQQGTAFDGHYTIGYHIPVPGLEGQWEWFCEDDEGSTFDIARTQLAGQIDGVTEHNITPQLVRELQERGERLALDADLIVVWVPYSTRFVLRPNAAVNHAPEQTEHNGEKGDGSNGRIQMVVSGQARTETSSMEGTAGSQSVKSAKPSTSGVKHFAKGNADPRSQAQGNPDPQGVSNDQLEAVTSDLSDPDDDIVDDLLKEKSLQKIGNGVSNRAQRAVSSADDDLFPISPARRSSDQELTGRKPGWGWQSPTEENRKSIGVDRYPEDNVKAILSQRLRNRDRSLSMTPMVAPPPSQTSRHASLPVTATRLNSTSKVNKRNSTNLPGKRKNNARIAPRITIEQAEKPDAKPNKIQKNSGVPMFSLQPRDDETRPSAANVREQLSSFGQQDDEEEQIQNPKRRRNTGPGQKSDHEERPKKKQITSFKSSAEIYDDVDASETQLGADERRVSIVREERVQAGKRRKDMDEILAKFPNNNLREILAEFRKKGYNEVVQKLLADFKKKGYNEGIQGIHAELKRRGYNEENSDSEPDESDGDMRQQEGRKPKDKGKGKGKK